jgi:NAD(P) transhydrogenase subunit alpha
MTIKIGILKESVNNETRVAIVPEICQKLSGSGVEFVLQKNSGLLAGYHDSDYPDNCNFIGSSEEVLKACNVLLKVSPPLKEEVTVLKEKTVVVGFMNPFQNKDLIKLMAQQNIVSFSVELIPRISRAQSMEACDDKASIDWALDILGISSTEKDTIFC